MSEWRPVNERDITAVFRGVTTPVAELRRQIEEQGWEVTSVAN